MKILICAACLLMMSMTYAHGQNIAKMESHKSLVIVSVYVQGYGQEPMLLDTGSQRTIVNSKLLDVQATQLGDDWYGKNYKTPILPEMSIRISLAKGSLIQAFAADMTDLQKRIGYPIQGIVGQDLL